MIRRDGRALLVVGGSGSGKSTAAYAAASDGWDVLADDMSVFRLVDGSVLGWGFPKPLHVPGELLDEVPGRAEMIAGDERQRIVLPAPTVVTRDGCPVVGVVGVGHSSGDATLIETPGANAWLRFLLRSFSVAAAPWGARQVFSTAAAVARLPSILLQHDVDDGRRVAEAARLLDVADGLLRRRQ